ncbi:HNH endonuclease [Corallococcus praedator]|uniref:HNH endonuclease n=1 Tax=Corallococcus praedator TaxID=2316724 RepID=A0ABX9QGX0_9BACT|nr:MULTISPECIES: HNH endonuclease [Corallococcus]RKH35689.1 HNH endonuclease [Corallococcus sp. CA031C]RKI07635.1 HNH endonuclease [Corallococcus praedator]
MRYWWVNQKQTHQHEIAGGYLWSPKRNTNGARNQFYENMREAAPGDVVLSYWEGAIRAYGVVQSYCYDCPRPDGFSKAWDAIGYRVSVNFEVLPRPLAPKAHMEEIRPLLPGIYSPLQRESGNGLQSVYLAELPLALGQLLVALLNAKGTQIAATSDEALLEVVPPVEHAREQWEEHAEEAVRAQSELPTTVREALVKARRGQGLFRENVAKIEKACRITGVSMPSFLVASHIKPWRHSSNRERLDGNNGLLLSPSIDCLFDRGFISFADNGDVLVSPVASQDSLRRMGVDVATQHNVGRFSREQGRYLDFHRREIFLKSG